MFVFGFVGDSLVVTTTEPLLGAIQRLEMLTPRKQKEQSTADIVAEESSHNTHLSDAVWFGLAVLKPCKVTSPSLSPSIVFD